MIFILNCARISLISDDIRFHFRRVLLSYNFENKFSILCESLELVDAFITKYPSVLKTASKLSWRDSVAPFHTYLVRGPLIFTLNLKYLYKLKYLKYLQSVNLLPVEKIIGSQFFTYNQ